MTKGEPKLEWGYLSQYFEGVGAKRLTAVEIDPKTSHQHEFNGVQSFRSILGKDRIVLPSTVVWLPDEEDKKEYVDGDLTWYDARENVPNRAAEFRLFYPVAAETVIQRGSPGDLVVLALTKTKSVLVIVAPNGSTTEQQLLWLFGLPQELDTPATSHLQGDQDKQLTAASSDIIEAIGIEIQEQAPDLAERLHERFDLAFPSTLEMSSFARETAPEVSPKDDPDIALTTWYNHEELLFRTLERDIVSARIAEPFDNVDEFMTFSLSVHNRRKSRAGYALENHFEQILIEHGIEYSRGKVTEGNSKPDFVFPGIAAYKDQLFPNEQLTMLAVKSTCKDRWRQILAEAAKIKQKHLLTLEPGISANQTDEMNANNVRLIVPQGLHASYAESQRGWLIRIADFLEHARSKQGH